MNFNKEHKHFSVVLCFFKTFEVFASQRLLENNEQQNKKECKQINQSFILTSINNIMSK